jgi:hypothetical protein
MVSITKTDSLILFREIIAVHSENHRKHMNAFCGQNAVSFLTLKELMHIETTGL